MKINKVVDKPMMIHTKQKAKIHTVESKKAEIKGSNILATARESNVKSAKTGSGSFRKSTVHQVEKVRRGRIFRYRQNLEQAKKSIKTKNSSIKIAGVAGVNSALDQLEGGEEIKKASGIAYGTVKPVSNAASKGATLFRQKAIEAKKRKIKKVDAGKKVAKKGAKKAVKDTAKATTKVVATTTTTAVGTGLAPGVGTAIGIGAGYAAGVAIDYKNMKGTNRSRKLKFFLD